MMLKKEYTREECLAYLLRPIQWNWSGSVRYRQNVVADRHNYVRCAYPFLTDDEKRQADEWFSREKHSDLWD